MQIANNKLTNCKCDLPSWKLEQFRRGNKEGESKLPQPHALKNPSTNNRVHCVWCTYGLPKSKAN